MALFWIVLIILVSLFLINKQLKEKSLDKLVGLLVIIQFILFILAIATKDPLFEWAGIPTAWELLAEGVISGFAVWKYYLSPMENRIGNLEINTGKLETRVQDINENIKWIRDNCKISFRS